MTTATNKISYWHMTWDEDRRIQGETRSASFSLDLAHDVLFRLLVTPTGQLTNQKLAAHFYTEQAAIRFDAVVAYLQAFFLRLADTCNLSSPELAVTSGGRNSEFDFPRPSPSWIMIEEFCRGLHRHRKLRDELKKISVRWF